MDYGQEINKSDLEEHCSDCLCVGEMTDRGQQDVSATKAWRFTSVVEGRGHPKTLSKLKPFISRTKMYLSFSSNIRRTNNNFSFVELNTRLQSTGRNDLENLLNEKHNHGLQPSLPVSKLTTINTSSSKPFKLLPINFDIDADIFNIFLHQKSRQMFSISRWTAISDVVSPSHFQHNWLLPHPRLYREARHR